MKRLTVNFLFSPLFLGLCVSYVSAEGEPWVTLVSDNVSKYTSPRLLTGEYLFYRDVTNNSYFYALNSKSSVNLDNYLGIQLDTATNYYSGENVVVWQEYVSPLNKLKFINLDTKSVFQIGQTDGTITDIQISSGYIFYQVKNKTGTSSSSTDGFYAYEIATGKTTQIRTNRDDTTMSFKVAGKRVIWEDVTYDPPSYYETSGSYDREMRIFDLNNPIPNGQSFFSFNTSLRLFTNDEYSFSENYLVWIGQSSLTPGTWTYGTWVYDFNQPNKAPVNIQQAISKPAFANLELLGVTNEGLILFSSYTNNSQLPFKYSELFIYDLRNPQLGNRLVRRSTDNTQINFALITSDQLVWREYGMGNPIPYSYALYVTSTQPDSDGDGVLDTDDNCILANNADQRDSNLDGYGNACDPDFNNDGRVNSVDYDYWKDLNENTTLTPKQLYLDLDGDGFVGTSDHQIWQAMKGAPPGPSGYTCVNDKRENGEFGCDDLDGDGISFHQDNCVLIANSNQRDTNMDGFGNLCDADVDNNGAVGLQDVAKIRDESKKSADFNLDCDIDDNGAVNMGDVAKAHAQSNAAELPGPSGLTCANHSSNQNTFCKDSDGDGILDELDNCIEVQNGPLAGFCYDPQSGQQDSDGDGFGNACDADVNNNGAVDIGDISAILAATKLANITNFNSSYDLNCNGAVDINDVATALKFSKQGGLPGPSGIKCNEQCAGVTECSRNDYGVMQCQYPTNFCSSNEECLNNDAKNCDGQNICVNNSCTFVEEPCGDHRNCFEAESLPEGYSCELKSGRCETSSDCQDGLACNGYESCDVLSHQCVAATSRCKTYETCQETAGHTATCELIPGRCNLNTDCANDGLFCNGTESCSASNYCVSAGPQCTKFEGCFEEVDGFSCEYINQIPSAQFSVSQIKGYTDTYFTFDASASSDLETSKSQLLFTWDWEGDGVKDTLPNTTNAIKTRQFAKSGEYHVFLFVEDGNGNRGMEHRSISVLPAPECGNFYCEAGEDSDNCRTDCPLPECQTLNLDDVMIDADLLQKNLSTLHPADSGHPMSFQLNATNCVKSGGGVFNNCCPAGSNCLGREWPLECIKDECIVIDTQQYGHCVNNSSSCYFSTEFNKTICRDETTLDRLNNCADKTTDNIRYHFLDRMNKCRITPPSWCGFGCKQLKEKYCHNGYCPTDEWWFQAPAFCTNSSTPPDYDSQRAKLHGWLNQFGGATNPNAYNNILNGCPLVGLNEDELQLAGLPNSEINNYRKQGIFYIENLLAQQRPTIRATSIVQSNYSWFEYYDTSQPVNPDQEVNWDDSKMISPFGPDKALTASELMHEQLSNYAINEVVKSASLYNSSSAYQYQSIRPESFSGPKTLAVVVPGYNTAFPEVAKGAINAIVESPTQNGLDLKGGGVDMITASPMDTPASVVSRMKSAINFQAYDNVVYVTNGIGLAAARDIQNQTKQLLKPGGKTATLGFAPFGLGSLEALEDHVTGLKNVLNQSNSLNDLDLWLVGTDDVARVEIAEAVAETEKVIADMKLNPLSQSNTQVVQSNMPDSLDLANCQGARAGACTNNGISFVKGLSDTLRTVAGDAELASNNVSDASFAKRIAPALGITDAESESDDLPFLYSSWNKLVGVYQAIDPFKHSGFNKDFFEPLVRDVADPTGEFLITTDFRKDVENQTIGNFVYWGPYQLKFEYEQIENELQYFADRIESGTITGHFPVTLPFFERHVLNLAPLTNKHQVEEMQRDMFGFIVGETELQRLRNTSGFTEDFVRFITWHEGAHIVNNFTLRELDRTLSGHVDVACEGELCTVNEARADAIASIKLYQYGLHTGRDTTEILKLVAEYRSRVANGVYHGTNKVIEAVLQLNPNFVLGLTNAEVIGLANKLVLGAYENAIPPASIPPP